ncbi:MAG: methyltransferase domain-containing protein, partial [Bacteroidota bacterium]
GDIEKLPVGGNLADVVVSNCVLNLVPDKEKAFSEIYRVLKPGGHFSISDVVLVGELPEAIIKDAEMYAGCVAGAQQKSKYMSVIEAAGFTNVTIQKEKAIVVPDDILLNYISRETIDEYKNSGKGIYSVTVYAEKPAAEKPCCGPSCCN